MYTPQESPALVATSRRQLSLGLPAGLSPSDRRFPLTPEAVSILTEQGFTVKMQSGASEPIHYTDIQYLQAGAAITERDEALRCDIVVHLGAISASDARHLRRGAMLLTLFHPESQDPQALTILLQRGVIAIALDLIADRAGNRPFADILSEIDGRAAMAIASSLLADAAHGKGILLGGIAGIVPCEVTVIGSGIAAVAAARSAIGLGALVRMFDNDVYRLRSAMRELGPGVSASALHPRVLMGALRSADVVVNTEMSQAFEVGAEAVSEMKRGVVIFDLVDGPTHATFPSLPTVDLARATAADTMRPGRVCYINAGNAVPRTAAMALSNTFLTMIAEIVKCDGVTAALRLNPSMQRAVYTFMGRAVNRHVARLLGVKYVDINFFLQFS